MDEPGLSAAGLQASVDRLVATGRAPALSIAIWRQGQLHLAAAGVLSVETRSPVSTDTLFQIGSISKVFTASLVMLLVDEGKLDLDVPIRSYLRDFHVADAEATRTITARHLLSHTSGMETDIYVDDQWEQGNAIARYMDRCFLLPQVHKDFGKTYSYSNAAYVVAGRLVEVVAGMPWAQAVEGYIYKPLGMTHALSSPLQTARFSLAAGHLYAHGGADRWKVAPHAFVPKGMAPAGSALALSASDLLTFGRAHLDGGGRWMSERSVRAMQELQVRLPARTSLLESGWGLGWSLSELNGAKSFGHGGGRIGYQALLQIIPEQGVVLSVVANGMSLGAAPVVREALSDLVLELTGSRPSSGPPVEQQRDLDRFVGQYGASGFQFNIAKAGPYLAVEFLLEGLATGTTRFTLRPAANDTFAVYSASGEYAEDDVVFLDPDEQGIPRYFFFGNRLNARVIAGSR
jgi:CubicO group peptidase (beta-lactamase class C family)